MSSLQYFDRQCEHCNKIFKFPYLLDKHMNANNACTKRVDQRAAEYSCKYCSKPLTTKASHCTHEKSCKFNDEVRKLEMQTNTNVGSLYNSIRCRFCSKTFSTVNNVYKHTISCKQKERYIRELKGKTNAAHQSTQECPSTSNTYNMYTDCNQFNIYNGPVLVKFGEENTEYIDIKMILRILQGCRNEGFGNIPEIDRVIAKIVRNIHCHPNHKENHNVLMAGQKKSICHVFTGKEFEVKDAKEICQKLVDKASGLFQDVAEEIGTEPMETQEKFMHLGGKNTVKSIQMMEEKPESSKQYGKSRSSVKDILCKYENKESIKNTKKEYDRAVKKQSIAYTDDGTIAVQLE